MPRSLEWILKSLLLSPSYLLPTPIGLRPCPLPLSPSVTVPTTLASLLFPKCLHVSKPLFLLFSQSGTPFLHISTGLSISSVLCKTCNITCGRHSEYSISTCSPMSPALTRHNPFSLEIKSIFPVAYIYFFIYYQSPSPECKFQGDSDNRISGT